MKIDRLIGITTILLQQDKVTAPELANRFEVSRRTITRDIESLSKAGIPIITLQGLGGGISIDERYKIGKSLFSKDELVTILVAAAGIDSVRLEPASRSIAEKLTSSCRDITSDGFMKIDLASHYKTQLSGKIDVIKAAILDHKYISFDYCSPKGESHRRVEPYLVLFQWNNWYVFGYCCLRHDFRVFKLNRLYNLQSETMTFSPRKIPADKEIFTNYFLNTTYKLKAKFCSRVKYRLIEEYGQNSFSILNDGSLFLERNFSSYENMLEWMLSFGDKATVIEPKKLKDDILNQAKNILSRTEKQDI